MKMYFHGTRIDKTFFFPLHDKGFSLAFSSNQIYQGKTGSWCKATVQYGSTGKPILIITALTAARFNA